MIKTYWRDGDLSKIENYELAKKDNFVGWDCHHRDEIRTLPSGITVFRSKQELIENGRYYNCPANELIFMTHSEHQKLHKAGEGNPNYGKPGTMKGKVFTAEHKANISASKKGENNPNYGKKFSDERKAKISTALTGKKLSDEHKAKLSVAHKGKTSIHKGKHWKIVDNKRVYY